MNASRSSAQNVSHASGNVGDMSEIPLSFDESVLQLLDEPFDEKTNSANLRTDPKYQGFDSTMGHTWIYPTNYPVRQYQHHISRNALFKNTLVIQSIQQLNVDFPFLHISVFFNFICRWFCQLA